MININFSIHWLQILYWAIGSLIVGYLIAFSITVFRILVLKKPYDEIYHSKEDEFTVGFVVTTWAVSLPVIAYVAIGAALSALDEKNGCFLSKIISFPAILFTKTLRGIYNFRNSRLWKKITMSRKMKDIRSEAMKAIKEQQEKNPVFIQNPMESGIFKDFLQEKEKKQEAIKKEALKAIKKQKQGK